MTSFDQIYPTQILTDALCRNIEVLDTFYLSQKKKSMYLYTSIPKTTEDVLSNPEKYGFVDVPLIVGLPRYLTDKAPIPTLYVYHPIGLTVPGESEKDLSEGIVEKKEVQKSDLFLRDVALTFILTMIFAVLFKFVDSRIGGIISIAYIVILNRKNMKRLIPKWRGIDVWVILKTLALILALISIFAFIFDTIQKSI